MKFETVRIHFQSDVGLLSSKKSFVYARLAVHKHTDKQNLLDLLRQNDAWQRSIDQRKHQNFYNNCRQEEMSILSISVASFVNHYLIDHLLF